MEVQRKKRKTVRNYCAVLNCLNTSRDPDMKFHQLPQDPERRRAWLIAVDREDLLKKEKFKSHVVCSDHFEKSDFKIITKLREDAVPSKYLPKHQEGTSHEEVRLPDNTGTHTEKQSIQLKKYIKETSTSSKETQTESLHSSQSQEQTQVPTCLTETPQKPKIATEDEKEMPSPTLCPTIPKFECVTVKIENITDKLENDDTS